MKSLLLTGSSGFLGKYLAKEAIKLFVVKTIGRSQSADYQVDLSTTVPQLEAPFDWVIHNAGKAHIVPKTPAEADAFYQVNHQGTLNLLAGLAQWEQKPEQFILISTIAVYGLDSGENIPERAALNGSSPYAKSKILAENAVLDWCKKHGVACVILRLPLVVGENAPGNLGAIRKAIDKGYYFRIKNNMARKSAVLAEDVARLIPALGGTHGIFNLTDGAHPSFAEIENAISTSLGKPIRITLPFSLLAFFAKIGDLLALLHLPSPLNSDKLKKMTATLTFDDRLARQELGWQPRPAFPN